MSIDTINYLNKQKKKLALIFTLAIFIIILTIETSFLIFKYIDYKKQQFQRLNTQLSIISRGPTWNNIFPGMMANPFIGWWEWDMWFPDPVRRARSENVIILDAKTSNITFSSFNDSTVAKEIISQTLNWSSEDTLEYNWVEFFYLTKDLDDNSKVFIFTQSKITKDDLYIEFIEYVLFLLLFSLVLYYFWYRFVSYNLAPVEENLKDMEQFIFNAWHELKTPLAVMKSSLQLAKAKNDYKDSTVDTINEIWKMNRLIESLINLSTIKKEEKLDKINVWDEVSEILNDYTSLIEDKNIKLKVYKKQKSEITANKEYFRILFSNLISNAIKYNKEQWSIEITIDKWTVLIKDAWIGIKKENIWKIFESFYREEESRNEESLWIWLSLVKKIIDIYGWEIKVDSKPWIWTEIKIVF